MDKEYARRLLAGEIPMENPRIKKPGDPAYYYFDPRGVTEHTKFKDRKLIGVPTADTPNPALVDKQTQFSLNNKFNNNGIKYAQNNNMHDFLNIDYPERFKELNKMVRKNEGGYNGLLCKETNYKGPCIDQITNKGITQNTLNNFRNKYPQYQKAFPEHVKYLNDKQTDYIYYNVFYKPYNVGEIKDFKISKIMYDYLANHSPQLPIKILQEAINTYGGKNIEIDGIIGSKTIQALNEITENPIIRNKIIEEITKKRDEYLRIENSERYYNTFKKGWNNRKR